MRLRRAGRLLALALLLGVGESAAAKAKGAGGFEGVECPEGFELQDNGACLKPMEDEEPMNTRTKQWWTACYAALWLALEVASLLVAAC